MSKRDPGFVGLRGKIVAILVIMLMKAKSPMLIRYIKKHLDWLRSLDNNMDFYDPCQKEKIINIKNFLKYPERHFEQLIDYMSEYMNIRYVFTKFDVEDERHLNMDNFFTDTVAKLEECLRVIHNRLKDFTVDKQVAVNHILDKNRCLDVRDDINKYLYVDANVVEAELFQKPTEDYYDELFEQIYNEI